jgi:hypothetical protein
MTEDSAASKKKIKRLLGRHSRAGDRASEMAHYQLKCVRKRCTDAVELVFSTFHLLLLAATCRR